MPPLCPVTEVTERPIYFPPPPYLEGSDLLVLYMQDQDLCHSVTERESTIDSDGIGGDGVGGRLDHPPSLRHHGLLPGEDRLDLRIIHVVHHVLSADQAELARRLLGGVRHRVGRGRADPGASRPSSLALDPSDGPQA